jgi:hypothetical protein
MIVSDDIDLDLLVYEKKKKEQKQYQQEQLQLELPIEEYPINRNNQEKINNNIIIIEL